MSLFLHDVPVPLPHAIRASETQNLECSTEIKYENSDAVSVIFEKRRVQPKLIDPYRMSPNNMSSERLMSLPITLEAFKVCY